MKKASLAVTSLTPAATQSLPARFHARDSNVYYEKPNGNHSAATGTTDHLCDQPRLITKMSKNIVSQASGIQLILVQVGRHSNQAVAAAPHALPEQPTWRYEHG